jgi:hypothetical protein
MSNRPAVLPVECKSISACRCNGINKYARSSAPPNRLMLFPRFLISKEPFARHIQTVCTVSFKPAHDYAARIANLSAKGC